MLQKNRIDRQIFYLNKERRDRMETGCRTPLIYKRIILKITGEALPCYYNLDLEKEEFLYISNEISKAYGLGAQIGIVIGGGNILRGKNLALADIDRATADHMGMLATAINALFLQNMLEKKGIPTRVQTAIEMKTFAEPYIPRRAARHLEKNRIVILACGTGHPYCTTDYAAMLRSYELNADALLKGTKVNGLYDRDPRCDKEANFISEISYSETLRLRFQDIMDNSAFGLALDAPKKIPTHIFDIFQESNLCRLLAGEKIGSKIS